MKCKFDCIYEMVHFDCSERGCSDCSENGRCCSCVHAGTCTPAEKWDHLRKESENVQ